MSPPLSFNRACIPSSDRSTLWGKKGGGMCDDCQRGAYSCPLRSYVNAGILPFVFGDEFESRKDLIVPERCKTETRTTRLQGRNDFAHIVAGHNETHVLGILFNDWRYTTHNKLVSPKHPHT